MKFGDIDITVLLDMGPAFAGLEAATAEGIQGLIDHEGSGTCTVSLRRLGIDAYPTRVSRVSAMDLRLLGGPGRWGGWWRGLQPGPGRLVVLAIHEMSKTRGASRPENVRLVPQVLSIGAPPDYVSQMTYVPLDYVLHVPTHRVLDGWRVVWKNVTRLRALADRSRSMAQARFDIEDRLSLLPRNTADTTYASYAGLSNVARTMKLRAANAVHAR